MPYTKWRLIDDGTLDTVVEYECQHCGSRHDLRLFHVDRDENGEITDAGMDEIEEEICRDQDDVHESWGG